LGNIKSAAYDRVNERYGGFMSITPQGIKRATIVKESEASTVILG